MLLVLYCDLISDDLPDTARVQFLQGKRHPFLGFFCVCVFFVCVLLGFLLVEDRRDGRNAGGGGGCVHPPSRYCLQHCPIGYPVLDSTSDLTSATYQII